MTANEKITRAKRLLRHYIETAFEGSGLQWDNDNVSEVDEIVDLIVDAAVELSQIKSQVATVEFDEAYERDFWEIKAGSAQ